MRFHHKRFADFHAAAVARRQECLCFGHRQAKRLLAEHVLPRFRSLNRPRHMQMVRQGVVDHFNFGVCQQFLVGTVRFRNSQRSRGSFRLL
jgi:hypothetical protein